MTCTLKLCKKWNQIVEFYLKINSIQLFLQTYEPSNKCPTQLREDVNIFEAAANGCSVSAKVVASVVACYIAVMSLLAFVNATLMWLGVRVGLEELSFEVECFSHNLLILFPRCDITIIFCPSVFSFIFNYAIEITFYWDSFYFLISK